MRPWLRLLLLSVTLLAVAGGAVVLWIGSSYFLAPGRRAPEPRHRDVLDRPAEYGLALEPFTVTAADGVPLAALLATLSPEPGRAEKTRRMAVRLGPPPASPRGTAVLLHGRGGMKEDMLAIAERFVAGGYRCVVYDARCHGESGGWSCTFGHRETQDLSAVLDRVAALLSERGEDPGQVCAMGISLGAAVLLQSLPREPRLSAIVAVAPFATLPEVVDRAAKRAIHPSIPGWFVAGTMRAGGWRAGFDPFSISPLRSVATAGQPVFFAHGARDGIIPAEHSERLHAAAAGPKALRIVPDGHHSDVLAKGGDALYEEMIAFCLAAGAGGASSPSGLK